MNIKQTELLKTIEKDAVQLDWDKAFQGKSKGNRHLFRVNKIAKFLLLKEGGDKFITLAGAWTHDVSLAWGDDYDSKLVEKRTRKFLKKYGQLTNGDIARIVECATLHEKSGKSSNNDAKIVHDADVIDKCGSLGIIRHIWKMTNMLENRVLENEKDLDKLKKHLNKRKISIYTKTAIRISKTLDDEGVAFFKNKNSAISSMKLISRLAKDGKTSDTIARRLIKTENSNFTKLLKYQLSCQYLK